VSDLTGWGRSSWGSGGWNSAGTVDITAPAGMTIGVGAAAPDTQMISGWGREAWGDGPWGTTIPIIVTSAGAMTSGLGALIIEPGSKFYPTGVGFTASVGSVTVLENEVVELPTGVSATFSIGSVTIIADANIYPTGVSMTADTMVKMPVWGLIDTAQVPSYSVVDR
tara:strand:+ start:264 stop:764 length:501 start_codon:yes stop_codon:yes gene_type:complete